MKLDFWNNPLVVSAFRVKYRRGGLYNFTTIYLLLLVAGGMVVYYYRAKFHPIPWPKFYLLGLLGLQFFISCLVAAGATANSLRAEVLNRTLDFQRLAALSPRQILLGKLLGEPAFAYLLAIASVPLAAFCCTMGVLGASLAVLPLLYVNLFTSLFLVSTLGLIQPLEPAAGKPTGGAGGNIGWGLMGFLFIAQLAATAGRSFKTPWAGALAGLVTPLPVYLGVAQDDVWQYRLSFYGLHIPFLFVTPVSQLLLAGLFFQLVVRRLLNPLNPQLSKPIAYLTLLVVDLLAGGVLYDPIGMPLPGRIAGFCLVHLLTGLGLVTAVTPWRESLQSWVWRLRGRSPRLWDLWVGARSENVLALATFCVIGLVGLLLFVVLPAWLEVGGAAVAQQGPQILAASAATLLLLFSLGTVYQCCVALAGRNGRGIFVSLTLLLILPAHLVGSIYHLDWLLAFTPSAHFMGWFGTGPQPALVPLLVLYAVLNVVAWVALRRYMARMERVVDQKLQQMGVSKPAA